MGDGLTPAGVISADPPWPFKDPLPGKGRGAAKHYRLLSIPELCRFPLPPLADDAVLFLWRVASMVPEAYEVARAWGFEAKAEIVWCKTTKTGKRHFGMGRTVRAEHEVAIIATRGRPTRLLGNVRSVFHAPIGQHSEKPAEFYRIVESLYPGPYVELFSRHEREGWTGYGNELGKLGKRKAVA